MLPYLCEADVCRLLTEALTADIESVFADETGLVCADAAVSPLVIVSRSKRNELQALYGSHIPYHPLAPLPYVRGREYQTDS